jgi:hypothetical protein
MDQSTFNSLIGIAGACGGWFLRMLWDRQELIRADLAKLEVKMVGEYVTHEKLTEALDGLRGDVKHIRDRIDLIPTVERRAP